MMNFMKMRTFYKKLPLFIKNCPLLFIKNSMLQIVIYKKLNFWEEYTPLLCSSPVYKVFTVFTKQDELSVIFKPTASVLPPQSRACILTKAIPLNFRPTLVQLWSKYHISELYRLASVTFYALPTFPQNFIQNAKLALC